MTNLPKVISVSIIHLSNNEDINTVPESRKYRRSLRAFVHIKTKSLLHSLVSLNCVKNLKIHPVYSY